MTLRELLSGYPEFFYPQTWYTNHAFLDTEFVAGSLTIPQHVATSRDDGCEFPTISAVHLAVLYIGDPTHEIWKRYLWCTDVDDQQQRVYVGSNGQGFEIHRHLHLTSRWGVPSWT